MSHVVYVVQYYQELLVLLAVATGLKCRHILEVCIRTNKANSRHYVAT